MTQHQPGMDSDDMFESYKEEFLEYMNKAREHLQIAQTAVGTKRQKIFVDIKKNLREAQALIPSMIISSRTAGRAENRELVEGYEQALKKLKEELEVALYEAEQHDTVILLGNKRQDDRMVNLHPTRSMAAQQQMQQSTSILEDASRTGEETLNTGVSVLEELGRQREVLGHSRNALGDINTQLAKARTVMNEIWGKMTISSILRGIIIIALIFACCFVVYFRFIWSPSSESPWLPDLPPLIPPTGGPPTGGGNNGTVN